MADSKRLDIMQALGAALETITTVNGYVTNAGNKVFEWQPFPLTVAQTPGIIYRDTDDPIEVIHNYALHVLGVEIYFAGSGTESPTTVRNVLADINDAIYAQKDANKDTYFSQLVLNIDPVSSPIEADQARKKIAGSTATYDFYFLTPKLSSYNT